MKSLLVRQGINVMQGPQLIGPSGAGTDADASDYFARIEANSGTISLADRAAFVKFVRRLKNAGVWSKLVEVVRFGGDQLAAAMVKLKDSGSGLLLNNSFVLGDLSVRGLTGNGSSKWIDTQTVPSARGVTWADQSFGVYTMGAATSSQISGVALGSAGATYLGYSAGDVLTTAGSFSGTPAIEGLQCVTANGTTLSYYWQGGDTTATTAVSGSAAPGGSMRLFQHNGSFFSSSTISGYFIGKALTSTEVRAINNAYDLLQGDLLMGRKTNVMAFFGDSITRGALLADVTTSFPYLVTGALGYTRNVQGIDSTLGSGRGVQSARGSALSRLIAAAPSRVVIVYGTNDLLQSVSTSTYQTDMQQTLELIKRACHVSGSDIVMAGIPYVNPATATNGALVTQTAFTNAAAAAAAAAGCRFVDLNTPMLNGGANSLLNDSVHPNSAGHAIIADAILTALL